MAEMPPVGGRYVIKETLGTGGFAMVYRARDPVLERDVALKVLHAHLARDESFRGRFVREGRILARIRHPNMVQVHDAGESGDTAYLAMELVEGRSLETIIQQRGVLPLDETVAIAAEVAAALEAVHAQNLVHRDVKPSNVLIEEPSGRAVLLDLGVARDMGNATITSSIMLGTPGFMAPEQVLEGGAISPQTDVYQLAATVYVMLCGQPPFVGDSYRVMDQVVTAPPPDLGDLRPDLPPAVIATVAEAMAKNPDRRPHGALTFAALLREAAAAPSPSAVGRPAENPIESAVTVRVPPVADLPPPLPVQAAPAAGGRRAFPMLLAGIGAVAALAMGAGLVIARGGDDQPLPVTATVTPVTQPPASPTPTPTVSPTRVATDTPSPTATRGPTAAATRTTPTPTVPAGVEAAIRTRMALRQYQPDGEIVTVATSGREMLYVQKGICRGSATGRCQIVFIFLGTEFLGTDTAQPSATIRGIAAAGRDRFTVTYADYAATDPAGRPSRPDVTITYTWDGSKLTPSGTPPGH